MRALRGAVLCVMLAAIGPAPGRANVLSFVQDLQNGEGLAGSGLFGAAGVATSPDGVHVYVASLDDNAVTVFARDATTGALRFVESEFDGVGGVHGIQKAVAVTVSPDGKHVYAAGFGDNAVAAFARDATTGALQFIGAQVDGSAGVSGLRGVSGVTVSPDGAHVYVASAGFLDGTRLRDSAVAVFRRNPTTGALSFVEAQIDGAAGTDGLNGAHGVAVSPDGAQVYVASNEGAVAIFRRNSGSGVLSFVAAQVGAGLAGANGVAISPDGADVYVASFIDSAVVVFARDAGSGMLTLVETQVDGARGVNGLGGAQAIAMSRDGARLYVASVVDNAVAVFRRDAGSGALTFVDALFDGIGGVDGLGGVNALAVTPDGAHVYAASVGDSAVAIFRQDAASGALSFVDVTHDEAISGLSGAHAVAVSPDGANVYVAGFTDDAVVTFRRDAVTGELSFVGVQVQGVGGVDGLESPDAVAVSPDGGSVYVTSFFGNSLSVFARHPATGVLTPVQVEFDGQNGVDGLEAANAVAVSPDGAHVYVASYFDSAVAVFSRSSQTGAVTFVEAHFDAKDGVDGLFRASSLVVSADGAHVYVASQVDNAVAVFSRNPQTGALTFVEAQVDGQNGVEGLSGATSVAASPDGAYVYALGDGAAVIFRRDVTSGRLAYVATQVAGVSDGEGGATAITSSPDGQYVYVTRGTDDGLAVFGRDASSGALTLLEVHFNGVGGVKGLAGANAAAVSPDNRDVYVAARFDNAVAVFGAPARVVCAGDCDGDGAVTVDELIRGVNIGLGTAPITDCPSFDISGDGEVSVDELVRAVGNALNGCAAY